MSGLAVRYVALGDSTGVGIGARHGGYVEHLFQRLRRTRPGVGLLNLCAAGATSHSVLTGQLPKAQRSRPHLVTLKVGINDVTHGIPPHSYESTLDRLVGELSETGAAVVLANLPDMSLAPVARLVPPGLLAGRVEALNAAVARVVARHGCSCVDLYAYSRVELPEHPEYFSADGFHPSDSGYMRMADHFWPVLTQALVRAGLLATG